MAEFSIWHVLPTGEMPTVRQVLECGGGRWRKTTENITLMMRIGDSGAPEWKWKGSRFWTKHGIAGCAFVCIDPRPIEAPMPTPAEVGDESRWVVMSMHGPMRRGVDVWRMPCTLRNDRGVVEVKWDDHGEWQYLAPFWGAGMVAIKESTCTSE